MGRTYEPDEPAYTSEDRVWVVSGRGSREPGVVSATTSTGVVYLVDLAGPGSRAVEDSRLSFREKGEDGG